MTTDDELEQRYNAREGSRYMTDVVSRNEARRQNPQSYLRVDPQLPQFSQAADDQRQLKALQQSDQAQSQEPTQPTELSDDELEARYESRLVQESAPAPQPSKAELRAMYDKGVLERKHGQPSDLEQSIGKVIEAVPGLSTVFDYLAMPREYMQGALTGKPGERVDPFEFSGADIQNQSRLEFAARAMGGMLLDPLILLGPAVSGMKAVAKAAKGKPTTPTIPAVEPTPALSQAPDPLGPPKPLEGLYDSIPKDGAYSTTELLTEPGSGIQPNQFRTGSGESLFGDLERINSVAPEPLPGPESAVPVPTPRMQFFSKEESMEGSFPEYIDPIQPIKTDSGKSLPRKLKKTGYAKGDLFGGPKLSFPKSTVPLQEKLPRFESKPVPKADQPAIDITQDALKPQRNYRDNLQTSARGSAAIKEAELDSGLSYSHIPEAPSDIPLVFPGWPSRITQSVVDTLKKVGPPGQVIANSIDRVLSNRAIATSGDTIATTQQLKAIAGVRGRVSKTIEGFRELTQGENAFIWGTHRYFNLNPLEIEQAFNYMYTSGKMIPQSSKARAFADSLYEGMLLKPSQEAHGVGLDLYNPITGKHTPFGAPHMFMPQIPTKAVSIQGISDTHLDMLYRKQGGEVGTGHSFPMWKSQLQRIMNQGGVLREGKAAEAGMSEAAIRYDMSSKRYKGLEVTRLLDLEALGGSPFQWAKKFGYETDPFRAAFRFNSSAYLRTEWAKAMPGIEKAMGEVATKGGADLTEWATMAIERAQGIHPGLSESRLLHNLVKGVRDFNNITMLQMGGLGSMSQLGYALGRAPLTRSMLGAVDFVVGNNRALVEKSGAVFPTIMNHMLQPEGVLATVSTGALRTYGISALDKWSRYFGGHIGVRYVDFLEKALLKYPQKERLHKLVQEMGGDVQGILREGKVPEAMKLDMVQRYANYSAGMPDVRGLPLIATSETAYAKLGNQYRSFLFSNQAELVRLWKNAPTTADAINRVTKIMLGTGATAATTGAMSEYIRNMFIEEEGNPFVNKKLKTLVGDDGAAFAIQTLVYGMGALFGSLALTSLDSGWKLAAQLTIGPTGALIAGTAEDVVDSIIHGPNWKSLRTAARRTPLAGPVLAPIVQEAAKEDQRIEQKRKQFRQSLMGQ